jgi:hypothetical protein
LRKPRFLHFVAEKTDPSPHGERSRLAWCFSTADATVPPRQTAGRRDPTILPKSNPMGVAARLPERIGQKVQVLSLQYVAL